MACKLPRRFDILFICRRGREKYGTWAQNDDRSIRTNRRNRRFQALLAHAAVDHRVDPAVERCEYMCRRGRADETTAIRGWRGDRQAAFLEQGAHHGVRGHAYRDRFKPCSHGLGKTSISAAREHKGERPRPVLCRQLLRHVGKVGQLARQFQRCHMDDERVEIGPTFCAIYP